MRCGDAHYGAVDGVCQGVQQGTVDVGSYARDVSVYGVYDLAGNAAEIVNDYLQHRLLQAEPEGEPPRPRAWSLPNLQGR